MLAVVGIIGGVSLGVGGAVGFGVYEVFAHIMPRETGVPLGCVFGTLAGLATAGGVFVKILSGTEMP